MSDNLFKIVGNSNVPTKTEIDARRKSGRRIPLISITVLALLVLACAFSELIMTHDPSYLDLKNVSHAPSTEFFFGTDTMGRDIFSMIWYGGRISLIIGLLSTAISTSIAFIYGALSGISGDRIDNMLMRLTEIFLSIPSILVVIFLQAVIGSTDIVSISVVIGVTGWMSMAKIVRSEVRQLRNMEFVSASKCMGGGFFHILWNHFLPNFLPSVMFMVVMNVSGAIATESTLSFLGIGLPVSVISWGSMLSLAQNALLSKSWWIIIIPGIFLVLTLLCIANIGNYLREKSNPRGNNLS
jgi:peptide/nickel transport system permease protein